MGLLKGSQNTTSYSGSMVEPSDPYAREVWLQRQKQLQHQQHQPKKWLLPLVIGIVVLVIIPFVIILLAKKNKPDEEIIPIEDPEISDEESLADYYYELVSDPDYRPLFDNSSSRYSAVPTNITCADLKEVSKMNADMLNNFLDRGYIVIISGKGSHPYSKEGKSLLVYHGSYDDYIYRAIPSNCPTSIDPSASYSQYNSVALFENLTSDIHYYVWIDPKNLNQNSEDF